jgi:hypothetical protein
VWVTLSPWVIGFSTDAAPKLLHVAAGLSPLILAALRLWTTHHDSPQIPA